MHINWTTITKLKCNNVSQSCVVH